MQENYSKLITKIKIGRAVTLTLFIIAVFVLTAIFTFYENSSMLLFFFLLLILFLAYAFAIAVIIMPAQSSLLNECDPIKYIIINQGLNLYRYSKINNDIVYLNHAFFTGNFKNALYYISQIGNKRPKLIPTLIYDRAFCYFFLNEFDLMKSAINEYFAYISSIGNISEKKRKSYENSMLHLNLLVAVSCGDKENIEKFGRELEYHDKINEINKLETDYFKGLAAYLTDDYNEAAYRFMAVKDRGSKTVFSRYSEYYLNEIDLKRDVNNDESI